MFIGDQMRRCLSNIQMTSKQTIERIIDGDFGVRSGVYHAVSSTIRMKMDERGEYQYIFKGSEPDSIYDQLVRVDMMSDTSPDEDILAKCLFSKGVNVKYDQVIGYYEGLYAGHVAEGSFRENGSSGGVTSWILSELLHKGMVDGVIHAHEVDVEKEGVLFKYAVSRNESDVVLNAKTRYYPLELSAVLDEVKDTPGRYVVVGIPEFITELRLLCEVDSVFRERIVYTIGLVCGHQKTAKYVEALAWEHGIEPGDLRSVNFRVKQPKSTAYDYLQEFTGFRDGKLIKIVKRHDELFADHWPMGFFKSKFSDFTDNAFNELADLVLGDAWLDEYNSDGMGNNIVIVRNHEIAKLIKDGLARSALCLDEIDAETVKRSQSGLIHHFIDELPYRLYRQSLKGWVPKKRVNPSSTLPKLRKKVQDVRYASSTNSHVAYIRAVRAGDLSLFFKPMTSLLNRYNKLYHRIANQGANELSLREKLRIRTRVRRALAEIRHRIRIRTRIRHMRKTVSQLMNRIRYSKADGAIITLPGYFNYGNMVQRFAMQRFLQKNGYNFISYAKDQEPSEEEKLRFRYTYDFVERNIWRKQFDIKDKFNSYIVGSDQVWRKWGYDDIFDELGYYFLDFAKERDVKRIAYAASIGQDSLKEADYTDAFIPYAGDLVKKFDHVGMRESTGVDIVRKEWNVDADLVLDPTLLLEASDYDQLINDAPYEIKKVSSMFTYFILTDEPKRSLIARIAKDAGLIDQGVYLEKDQVLPPVEEWLAGIRDAQLVVVDSFHGMVFSIIYKTPFVVLESGTGGASRITTLLGELGLENRYVSSDAAKSFDVSELAPIDWQNIDERLNKLRQRSSQWLLDAVRLPKAK